MKCHYEVLDVPPDADDTIIKSAYRKLALKWHPDKNLDNPELAKTEFQLVQQAYETLSDRQERAWYDKHREQILYGSNSQYDSNLDIFKFFTSSCFKGYNDDENGFYTVYRKAFEEIIQDDIQGMMNKDDMADVPSFGTSTSDYEETVGPFYNYWMSYSTKKSFVWLDHYNIQEVRDRRITKLIEKEHKKTRQKAKKEWNEEVRALVAFVRKRDKRVKEYMKQHEAKVLENRQKNEELSKQKRLERQRMLNESSSEVDWVKFDNVKTELEQIEKSLVEEFGDQVSGSENEDDIDNLYCVACNKIFKSPKAFENHELSKKHKENVLRLKQTMDCASDASSDDLPNSVAELSDSSIEELEIQIKKKRKKKSKRLICHKSFSEDEAPLLKPDALLKDNDHKNGEEIPAVSSESPLDECQKEDTTKVNNSDEKPTKAKRSRTNKKHATGQTTESTNIDTNHCCVTCKAEFSSKNKLFNHLKKTAHSSYLPTQQSTDAKPSKNKRR